MQYHTVAVNEAITKITNTDGLFSGEYIIDPYQHCEFACRYCDSATTKEVIIKKNLSALVDKELRSLSSGRIILGSVHDPYQPVEEEQNIMRELLRVIGKHRFPVHVLTKSSLVLRDIDLLQTIPKSMVTISMISDDNHVARIFEPQVPSPDKRLDVVRRLAQEGITAGVAFMPFFPYLSDESSERVIIKAKRACAHYVIWEYLELKGDQRDKTLQIIAEEFPHLMEQYEELYAGGYNPAEHYVRKTNDVLRQLCEKHGVKSKITEDLC